MQKRKGKIQIAHEILCYPDKDLVLKILDNVNISPKQKDIIIKTELEKESLASLMDIYNSAYVTLVKQKESAMNKIADYVLLKTNNYEVNLTTPPSLSAHFSGYLE